jgi:hypothetical protein
MKFSLLVDVEVSAEFIQVVGGEQETRDFLVNRFMRGTVHSVSWKITSASIVAPEWRPKPEPVERRVKVKIWWWGPLYVVVADGITFGWSESARNALIRWSS